MPKLLQLLQGNIHLSAAQHPNCFGWLCIAASLQHPKLLWQLHKPTKDDMEQARVQCYSNLNTGLDGLAYWPENMDIYGLVIFTSEV